MFSTFMFITKCPRCGSHLLKPINNFETVCLSCDEQFYNNSVIENEEKVI